MSTPYLPARRRLAAAIGIAAMSTTVLVSATAASGADVVEPYHEAIISEREGAATAGLRHYAVDQTDGQAIITSTSTKPGGYELIYTVHYGSEFQHQRVVEEQCYNLYIISGAVACAGSSQLHFSTYEGDPLASYPASNFMSARPDGWLERRSNQVEDNYEIWLITVADPGAALDEELLTSFPRQGLYPVAYEQARSRHVNVIDVNLQGSGAEYFTVLVYADGSIEQISRDPASERDIATTYLDGLVRFVAPGGESDDVLRYYSKGAAPRDVSLAEGLWDEEDSPDSLMELAGRVVWQAHGTWFGWDGAGDIAVVDDPWWEDDYATHGSRIANSAHEGGYNYPHGTHVTDIDADGPVGTALMELPKEPFTARVLGFDGTVAYWLDNSDAARDELSLWSYDTATHGPRVKVTDRVMASGHTPHPQIVDGELWLVQRTNSLTEPYTLINALSEGPQPDVALAYQPDLFAVIGDKVYTNAACNALPDDLKDECDDSANERLLIDRDTLALSFEAGTWAALSMWSVGGVQSGAGLLLRVFSQAEQDWRFVSPVYARHSPVSLSLSRAAYSYTDHSDDAYLCTVALLDEEPEALCIETDEATPVTLLNDEVLAVAHGDRAGFDRYTADSLELVSRVSFDPSVGALAHDGDYLDGLIAGGDELVMWVAELDYGLSGTKTTVFVAGHEEPEVPETPEPVQLFSDVGSGHPFFVEIDWLARQGITGGYSDGTFRPGAHVSRQAMAAFLYRFAGEPAFVAPVTASFPDVPTSHDFFTEIEWLVAEGITTGYGDGTFRGGAAVSRQAMAAFLARFAGGDLTSAPATASFPDVPTGHDFFAEIEWLVAEGITAGYGDGTFRGGAHVSRQAMAAFLMRLNAAL